MPRKIYIVDLTKEDRTYLLDFIKRGKRSARKSIAPGYCCWLTRVRLMAR